MASRNLIVALSRYCASPLCFRRSSVNLIVRPHGTMKHFTLFVWSITLQLCCAATPELFRQRAFTAASFAEAVNHFIDLGENAAVGELRGLAVDYIKDHHDHRGEWSINERIGWMCRVLFESKTNGFIDPPRFGRLDLPVETMPDSSWPLYPVALSGSTYFVLSQGYFLAGAPQDPKDYIDECRKVGAFRKAKVSIPTRAQALKDAAALRQSKAWTSIKWKNSGPGWSYQLSEYGTWEFIEQQAEEIQ